MEYTLTNLKQSRIQIDITLSPEEWGQSRQKAERQLGENLRVEGFRQGKAPGEMVRQQLGEEAVLMETARIAVQDAYQDIVRKENLEAIGEPELTVKKLAPGNPFEFSLTVALLPPLKLPDYTQLASQVARKPVSVEDQEVEDALEWLRKSRKKEGEAEPELNDEFAGSLGNFGGLEEVRSSIKEGLTEEKEQRETQRVRQEILEKIAEHVEEEIPEVLVEREREGMMENVRRGVQEQLNMKFEDYLEKVSKSEEELKNEFGKEAEKRVKTSLILREIAKREGVSATPEEIEQASQQILSQYGDSEQAKQSIDQEQLQAYTKGVIENEKALQLLESHAQR